MRPTFNQRMMVKPQGLLVNALITVNPLKLRISRLPNYDEGLDNTQ